MFVKSLGSARMGFRIGLGLGLGLANLCLPL